MLWVFLINWTKKKNEKPKSTKCIKKSDRSSVAACSSSVNYGATITAGLATAVGKQNIRSQGDFSKVFKKLHLVPMTKRTIRVIVGDDDDDDYLSSKKKKTQSHISERHANPNLYPFQLKFSVLVNHWDVNDKIITTKTRMNRISYLVSLINCTK